MDNYRQDGDFVLLGEDGAPFLDPLKPKAYRVSGKCWVNNHAHVLRGRDGICDSDYLCFALNWVDYNGAVTGTTRLKLPQGTMHLLKIPAPGIDQQREIAAHLKAQLATVEEARQAAQTQVDELTQLANAIVRDSIAHPDTETCLLGEVLDEVKRGIGASWADYPVLGATRAGLALAKEPVGKHPERYKPVRVGTVFYNPMRILIGSIAMVDEADAPGITSPDYVVLRGREGVVDSRWFYYWLRSPLGEQCIASLARGAVRERMLFNRLAEGEIELPPYPVQQAASRALAELRPMKAKIEAQLREIELLPSRLLAQAFQ
ncbi:MAG: restriction endonuclease subunit S [Rhodocyclales bacterium]|nr:restriction endonuclease subunit S [Rhodocyclales bacterium]